MKAEGPPQCAQSRIPVTQIRIHVHRHHVVGLILVAVAGKPIATAEQSDQRKTRIRDARADFAWSMTNLSTGA